MKVVASTKLTRAEKAMREAKKYGAANNGAFEVHPHRISLLSTSFRTRRTHANSLHCVPLFRT